MQLLKKIVMMTFLIVAARFSWGQELETESDTLYNHTQSTLNDSVVFRRLEQIDVYPRKGRNLNYRRYSRIVAKIRKVYPFAKEAAQELEKYNEKFENATSEREKRRYVRQVEKELFAKHENELKRFTISEGRYLMLLIDRETDHSSYAIIKELKGGVPALFWQGIARLFGNDLKAEYDPVYRHYMIEQIVLMIEAEEAQKKKQEKQQKIQMIKPISPVK